MSDLFSVISIVGAALAILVAIGSIIAAIRAGVLTHLRVGNLLEIRTAPQARAALLAETKASGGELPFETEQLALYYGQVLVQSRVSFWFSLTFASIGFAVITVAVFLYTTEGTQFGAAAAQFAAGAIMDAVAALFFVQSRRAQQSMGEFFDKLRRDRQQFESRKLCESVEDTKLRDALRVRLSLHYADVAGAADVARSLVDSALDVAGSQARTAEA